MKHRNLMLLALLFALIAMSFPVNAQDYEEKAKNIIKQFLDKGSCEEAANAYDSYKECYNKTDRDVERRLRECFDTQTKEPSGKSNGEWVDLGLPSGTLWKDKNEDGDFYTYDKAVYKEDGDFYTYDKAVIKFGDDLPTREQLGELRDKCKWSWTGSGYKVTGPNGNSIYLPAVGYRGGDGAVRGVDLLGSYWSSTPNGSDDAWNLFSNSSKVTMTYGNRYFGFSVRLVQD